MRKLKLSLLEEAVIVKDHSVRQVFERSVEAALYIEKLGYHRIWFAEHHNMANIASSATSVLIGHIAEKTKHIRVGSGGIMLPNHSPLLIAEQFGTLDTLYPGRIDLGVGRAPGTDQITIKAIRRNGETSQLFNEDIISIQKYFTNTNPLERVRVFPGEGANVPIYVLGSGLDSARLAAEMGLPYVFAAHFAPAMLKHASEIYRTMFKPSAYLSQPYFIVAVNIVAAPTDEEAIHLSSSLYNLLSGVITNHPYLLAPPTDKLIYSGIPQIESSMKNMTKATFIGGPDTIRKEISSFVVYNEIDEIMMTNYIFDNDKKLESFKITREALNDLIN